MIAATPTTAQAVDKHKASPRVLVCVGSEGGSTKRLIARIIKKWQADSAALTTIDVMEGNAAIQKFGSLSEIAKAYDVMLVATCSYGCGEAPASIAMLFDLLLNHASVSDVPLQGMQHAVLGCGSTCYETFQNCPRLHDKFLEECGSRRLPKRAELDESHDMPHIEQPACVQWMDDVFGALHQGLPSADSPPACTWDSPQGKITAGMSTSTSCPTDVAPYYLCAFGTALLALVAAAWQLDSFYLAPVGAH